MALKNKSMYAILGILNIAPATGYDIKKYSDEVLSGFWNENFGHIYPTLKMLLSDGMIEIVPKGEVERKVLYQITQKGREELTTWLLEDTVQQPIRSEFLLKLLFSSDQPKEQVIHMLEDHRTLHQAHLTQYREKQEVLKQTSDLFSSERILYLNIVLRRGILSCEAMIRWCDETIEDISSLGTSEISS